MEKKGLNGLNRSIAQLSDKLGFGREKNVEI
jgi:hypothetical protein